MKTFTPTPKDIQREWFIVDADNKILGRLAAQIAHRLRGKHKPGSPLIWIMATLLLWLTAKKFA